MRGPSRVLRIFACGHAFKRGFTLVEVMIAGALAAILALGIGTMVSNMQRGVVSVQRKDDFIDFQKLIHMTGAQPGNCKTMFGDTAGADIAGMTLTTSGTYNFAGTNYIRLFSGTSSVDIKVGSQYGTGIHITGISFSWSNTTIGGSAYPGTLTITAERYDTTKPGAIVPGGVLSASIPVSLVDSNNNGKSDTCTVGPTSNYPRNEIVVANSASCVGAACTADYYGSTCAAVSSALAAAGNTSPARGVYIKGGTYTGCNDLVVPKDVTIRGDGGGATVLQTSMGAGSLGMFKITDDTNTMIVIRDLQIDLSGASSGGLAGIYVSGASGVTVERVIFTNSHGTQYQRAVVLTSSVVTTIDRIRIRNTWTGRTSIFRGSLVYARGPNPGISDIIIEGNSGNYYGPTGGGVIQVDTFMANEIKIINNSIGLSSTTGSMIYLDLSNATGGAYDRFLIDGNRFVSNTSTDYGVNVDSTVAGKVIKYLTITNNRFDGQEYGIFADNANITIGDNVASIAGNGAVISNNYITCSGTAATHQAINFGNTNNTIISKNIIQRCGGPAIQALAPSSSIGPIIEGNQLFLSASLTSLNKGILTDNGAVVKNNKIINAQEYGIKATGSDYLIEGNHITEAGNTAAESVCGGCGSACKAENIGICANGENATIIDNYISGPQAAVRNKGVAMSSGTASSSVVTLNNFADNIPATEQCSRCNTYSRIYSENGTTQYNSHSLNVTTGGGINVGTGSPAANALTINGAKVGYYDCDQPAIAATPPAGTSGAVNVTCTGGRTAIYCGGDCGGGYITRSYRNPGSNTCYLNCYKPGGYNGTTDVIYNTASCCILH